MNYRLSVFLVVAAVAGAAGLYASSSFLNKDASLAGKPRTVLVEVATVKMGTVRDRIDAVGTTEAIKAVNIVPLVSGRVEEINFSPGEKVKAKTALVRLNDAVASAQEQETRAEMERAKFDNDRAQALLGSRAAVSKATAEEREAAFQIAKARHEAALDALEERTIDAPFDGTVGFKNVDIGDYVSAGTVLTTLDDLSTIEIEFSVPEIYYGSVKEGMEVTAQTLAFGKTRFRGKISQVDTRIDPISRSFRIKAEIPNENSEIPTGMFMNVRVTLEKREAIKIPQEALVFQGEETLVYLDKDNVALQHPVTLGLRLTKNVEVTDGLSVGDRIVVKGIQNLRNGAPIRVVTDAPDNKPSSATPAGKS
ncbi:MAG: efflux RND transporter periplasmic adaptor subunit [Hyphomicrobiaceae bacterium]|nr:efflux RND transporter periplasmic adaptor subunit [Hyphomicrobiaceae bacterium]